jgi:phosphonate transport system substrate-binding protein
MRRIWVGLNTCLLVACSIFTPSIVKLKPEVETATLTVPAPVGTSAVLPHPTATAPALGTIENPIILALAPSSVVEGKRVEAGKDFADLLTDETGYAFVVVVPESFNRLIDALGQGNAHIVFLSPYAYAYAFEQGLVEAVFASVRSGEKLYGAQFIARTDAGFESYFNAASGQNLTDAGPALAQFNEKKPCWSDQVSPSGYVIPAGVLTLNGIITRPAAFLQGQPAVVRAVYAEGICDFGATYIDARTFPTVQEAYPDVEEKVSVIWQVPPVIPYENLSLSASLPPETILGLNEAIYRISGRQAGRTILLDAYGVGDWEPVSDPFYELFREYLKASGVDVLRLMDSEP